MPQIPNNVLDLPFVQLDGAHLVLVTIQFGLAKLKEVALEVLGFSVGKLELSSGCHWRFYLKIIPSLVSVILSTAAINVKLITHERHNVPVNSVSLDYQHVVFAILDIPITPPGNGMQNSLVVVQGSFQCTR